MTQNDIQDQIQEAPKYDVTPMKLVEEQQETVYAPLIKNITNNIYEISAGGQAAVFNQLKPYNNVSGWSTDFIIPTGVSAIDTLNSFINFRIKLTTTQATTKIIKESDCAILQKGAWIQQKNVAGSYTYTPICLAPLNSLTLIQNSQVQCGNVNNFDYYKFRSAAIEQMSVPDDVRQTMPETYFDLDFPSYRIGITDDKVYTTGSGTAVTDYKTMSNYIDVKIPLYLANTFFTSNNVMPLQATNSTCTLKLYLTQCTIASLFGEESSTQAGTLGKFQFYADDTGIVDAKLYLFTKQSDDLTTAVKTTPQINYSLSKIDYTVDQSHQGDNNKINFPINALHQSVNKVFMGLSLSDETAAQSTYWKGYSTLHTAVQILNRIFLDSESGTNKGTAYNNSLYFGNVNVTDSSGRYIYQGTPLINLSVYKSLLLSSIDGYYDATAGVNGAFRDDMWQYAFCFYGVDLQKYGAQDYNVVLDGNNTNQGNSIVFQGAVMVYNPETPQPIEYTQGLVEGANQYTYNGGNSIAGITYKVEYYQNYDYFLRFTPASNIVQMQEKPIV